MEDKILLEKYAETTSWINDVIEELEIPEEDQFDFVVELRNIYIFARLENRTESEARKFAATTMTGFWNDRDRDEEIFSLTPTKNKTEDLPS